MAICVLLPLQSVKATSWTCTWEQRQIWGNFSPSLKFLFRTGERTPPSEAWSEAGEADCLVALVWKWKLCSAFRVPRKVWNSWCDFSQLEIYWLYWLSEGRSVDLWIKRHWVMWARSAIWYWLYTFVRQFFFPHGFFPKKTLKSVDISDLVYQKWSEGSWFLSCSVSPYVKWLQRCLENTLIIRFENTLIKLITCNASMLCFVMHIDPSRAVNLPASGQELAGRWSRCPLEGVLLQFLVSMEVGASGRVAAAPAAFLGTRCHRYNFSLVVLFNYLLTL